MQQAVYEIKEYNSLEGHTDTVWGVSFSPDGQTIATASYDRTVRLWNLKNLDLNNLLVSGCNWLHDYLKTNPNVNESDGGQAPACKERHFCDGIGTNAGMAAKTF